MKGSGTTDTIFTHDTQQLFVDHQRWHIDVHNSFQLLWLDLLPSELFLLKHLFWFQLNYPSNLHGNFPATYTDIIIEDLTVENVGTVLEIHAPDAVPVLNVKFKDIKIKEAEEILILENADDISFENVTIGEQVWNGTFSSLHIESVTR